jgi:glycosyltransferase 2 family protein
VVQRLRTLAPTGLRVAVTLGIVAYLVRRIDVAGLGRALGEVRLPWLAAALALYTAGQILSVVKWAILGRAVGLAAPLASYLRFYFIGMFFNFLGVSTLGGDVARALYLGGGRRPGLALDSVLFDRVSGLAILALVGAAALVAFPAAPLPPALRAGVTVAGLALVAAWWTCPRLVRLLPETNRVRRQVETELAPFWRDRGVLGRAAAVSVAFHLSQVGVQWLLGRAAGLTVPLWYCLVFHPVLSVMMALPVSLGGFGVREGGYVYFLGKLGVPDLSAVTMGLLWWAVTAMAGLVGGVVFLASGAALPSLAVRSTSDGQRARS